MNNATNDKLNGHMNSALGSIKEAAGNFANNPQLKAEGQAQQVKGESQKAMGAVKTAVKDALHAAEQLEAKGFEKLGKVIHQVGDKVSQLKK